MLVLLAASDSDAPKGTPGTSGATLPPGATPGFEEGPASPSSLGKAVLLHTQFAAEIGADGIPVGESAAFAVGTTQRSTTWSSSAGREPISSIPPHGYPRARPDAAMGHWISQRSNRGTADSRAIAP